jgi:Uma2 family endonuclease
MTDEELLGFCERNEVLWIEREVNGDIHIKPIPGTLVGATSADVICALSQWVEREGQGELLAGAGFLLADGSMMGPRIALVSPERWATVAHREKDGFARFAPDFVVEFNGPWDEPGEMEAKMRQWIANGVGVGWLIDPKEKSVTIYRPGDQPEHLAHPTSVHGTGPIAGFELVMARIWE